MRAGQKFDAILSREESLCREVALGVITKRPTPLWHLFIPFKFIVDGIRLRRDADSFSSNLLFPRKLALNLAVERVQGASESAVSEKAEVAIKAWLEAHRLFAWPIREKVTALVSLLVEHYGSLLKADGTHYTSLLKNAYQTESRYAVFVQKIESLEKEVDQAVVDEVGGSAVLLHEMASKQAELARLRLKEVKEIFA